MSDFIWVEKYRPKTIDECILPDSLKKTFQDFLVAGRITGSVLIICAYFVILHVSTFYGAIMHIIADIICIPFYIHNKQWDVAIMLAFLMSIAISKVAILL